MFGLAFGRFLIYFGAGLLVASLGLVAREVAPSARQRRALAGGERPMSAPTLPTLVWRHWQPAWAWTCSAALGGAALPAAPRRVRGAGRAGAPLAFLAGVACVLVALQSGIDAYDDRLLSDHMVQHLLLLELAPLLLLAAARASCCCAAPRARRRRRSRAALRSCARYASGHLPGRVLRRRRGHPPAVLLRRDAASPGAARIRAVLYLTAGLLMWWPILDGDPVPGRRLDGLGRLVYVIAAMLPMTLLGAYLTATVTGLPAYGPRPTHSGISAVFDQQQAGAIMWVLGSTLMVGAGLWQAMAALVAEERRLQAPRAPAARHEVMGPAAACGCAGCAPRPDAALGPVVVGLFLGSLALVSFAAPESSGAGGELRPRSAGSARP